MIRTKNRVIFKYIKFVDQKKNVIFYDPTAYVTLCGKDNSKAIEFPALIDSGSDVTLIDKEVAEVLGLSLGEEVDVDAIGGSLKVKPSKVNMTFGEGKNKTNIFDVPCYILSDMPTRSGEGIVLGREKVFDIFKITFIQAEKQIIFEEIDPKWYRY